MGKWLVFVMAILCLFAFHSNGATTPGGCFPYIGGAFQPVVGLTVDTDVLKRTSEGNQDNLRVSGDKKDFVVVPKDFPKNGKVDTYFKKIAGQEGQTIRVFDFGTQKETRYTIGGYRLEGDAYFQKVSISGPFIVVVREATDSPFEHHFPEPAYKGDVPGWRQSKEQSRNHPRELLVADTRAAGPDGVIPATAVKLISPPRYDMRTESGGNYIYEFETDGPFVLIKARAFNSTNADKHYIVSIAGGEPVIQSIPNSHGHISLAYDAQNLIINAGPIGYKTIDGQRDKIAVLDPVTLGLKGPIELFSYSNGSNIQLKTVMGTKGESLLVAVRQDFDSTDVEIVNLQTRVSIFSYSLRFSEVKDVTDIATDGRNLYLANQSNVAVLDLVTREVRRIARTQDTVRLTYANGILYLYRALPVFYRGKDDYAVPYMTAIPVTLPPQ